MMKRAQEQTPPHPSLPDLIERAQNALAKSDVKEMQEVFHALYPFIGEAGKPQIRFVKSGITL